MEFTLEEVNEALKEIDKSILVNNTNRFAHHATCWIWLTRMYDVYNDERELTLQEDMDIAKFIGE